MCEEKKPSLWKRADEWTDSPFHTVPLCLILSLILLAELEYVDPVHWWLAPVLFGICMILVVVEGVRGS